MPVPRRGAGKGEEGGGSSNGDGDGEDWKDPDEESGQMMLMMMQMMMEGAQGCRFLPWKRRWAIPRALPLLSLNRVFSLSLSLFGPTCRSFEPLSVDLVFSCFFFLHSEDLGFPFRVSGSMESLGLVFSTKPSSAHIEFCSFPFRFLRVFFCRVECFHCF
jgi:hypothetical protein